jgi:asparagine synthase (glutamine-hydrolysing)
MCGIVGFTGKKNLDKLSHMLAVVEHRGRDGRTLFYTDHVHLGMNRLAIIDLTRNLYPMRYKQYTLVFNGEIYNYQELKKRLRALGVSFTTTSDAEVILPLFYHYGLKAFSMLEGMFAISIYDKKKKQILLIRDKAGEKPLYVMNVTSGFAFASEIKVLLSFNDNKKTIDHSSLSQYLRQGFVFTPDTLVHNIKKVPPSSCLIYDMGTKRARVITYWAPHPHSVPVRSTIQSIDVLEKLLRKSVRMRLVADVPVGCFLSGGVDSSLITHFASLEKPNIQTYSVAFPGYEHYDESEFASFVAKRLKTRHTVVACTAQRVRTLLDHIGTFIDEPIIDPAVLPTILMAQEARKHVKVVLTGEGADELFGGYERYRKQLLLEKFRWYCNKIPLLLIMLSHVPIRRAQIVSHDLTTRYSAQHVWNDKELSQLLLYGYQPLPRHQYLRTYAATNPFLSMQLTDFRGYMAEQLLMKIDKSTMARNLEARAPYLDTHIINFAFSLENRDKLRSVHGKYILKKLAERYFPKSFVWRPKHGFDIPIGDWFRKELRDYVKQSVDDIGLFKGIFNIEYYKRIVDEHESQHSDHSAKIWSILVLVSWMKAHDISV